MKKVIMFCCIILAALSCAVAQNNEGIHFDNDSLSILLAKAKKENKLIFIDAYTSWCGPCKWMAANIFTNDTVAQFYNANFINVQIDMEKGEGPDIAKRYTIQCYPTFLFIDGTGKLIHRKSGMCIAQEFIKLGERAMNPETQYFTIEKKYESGTATTSEFVRYLEMRQLTCLPIGKQIAYYDSTQSETDFAKRSNWTVLYMFVTDLHSRMFQYMMAHRDIYDAQYTADSVNQVMSNVYGTAMSQCLWKQEPDTDGYKKLRGEIIALHLSSSDKLLLGYDMYLYTVTKDWNRYAQAAMTYEQKYAKDNYMFLNNVAWAFYEHIDDAVLLDTAIAWAKKSVELQPQWFNTDTYTALLYKRGNYKEALVQAKAAIELGKKEGSDVSTTEQLLEKIKEAQKRDESHGKFKRYKTTKN